MSALEEQYGLVPPSSDDVWDALARWEPPDPVVLVVHAAGERDFDGLETLAARLPATSRSLGLIGRSPRLLVVAPPDGVSPQLLEDDDGLSRVIEWWWDVVGRLDVLVLAALLPAPDLSPNCTRAHMDQVTPDLFPEVVAEVAAWDLDLASALITSWDGTRVQLDDHLDLRALGDGVDVRTTSPVPARRPTQRLLEPFARGAVLAWGGAPRSSLAYVSASRRSEQLDRALQVAQHRALTAALEQRRAACERHFRELRDRHRPVELATRLADDSPMEFTQMFDLARGGAQVPRHVLDCITCSRKARNDLAHLRVVDDVQLRHLAAHRP